ncbi:MAG: hypothetical protein LC637_11025 [Xanthomonadaceae bacterium]|nr:hypothetical protein [Xanthomonadaceae bacterium]
MILGYRDKKTEQFAKGDFVKAFQGFEDQAARRLSILNAALSLDMLRALPGNRLEAPNSAYSPSVLLRRRQAPHLGRFARSRNAPSTVPDSVSLRTDGE